MVVIFKIPGWKNEVIKSHNLFVVSDWPIGLCAIFSTTKEDAQNQMVTWRFVEFIEFSKHQHALCFYSERNVLKC